MTQKTNQNPWLYDTRVRERHLRSGAIGEKDVERYFTQLPDVADQAEPFATPQPALALPEAQDDDLASESDDDGAPER